MGHDRFGVAIADPLRHVDLAGQEDKGPRRDLTGAERCGRPPDRLCRSPSRLMRPISEAVSTGNISSRRASIGDCEAGCILLYVRFGGRSVE